MEFKNLDDLNKYLQSNINDILQNEIAESVKDTMLFAVNRTVYDKYDPLYYVRRGGNGGLGDGKNIVVIDEGDTIFVENRTLVNDNYGAPNVSQLLTPIVVSGQGYTYSGYGKAYEQERDFIDETTKLLKKDKLVEKKLKDGLKKRGIQCG